jgi:hypothetical protein
MPTPIGIALAMERKLTVHLRYQCSRPCRDASKPVLCGRITSTISSTSSISSCTQRTSEVCTEVRSTGRLCVDKSTISSSHTSPAPPTQPAIAFRKYFPPTTSASFCVRALFAFTYFIEVLKIQPVLLLRSLLGDSLVELLRSSSLPWNIQYIKKSRRAMPRHLLGLKRSPVFGRTVSTTWVNPKIGDDILEDVFAYSPASNL